MTGFNPDVIKMLIEPLKVYHRKGPGGTYPYVKGEDVIKQLNKSFGHAWSSRVVSQQETQHGQVLVLVEVSAMVDGTTVVHQGFGSAAIAKNSQSGAVIDIGNCYKSAFTTALKKAAEQFGVGLQAEEDDAPVEQLRQLANKAPAPSKPTTTREAYRPTTPAPAKPAPTPAPAPVEKAAPPAPVAGPSSEKKVSDVQKRALTNIANMKKFTESELLSSALPDSGKVSYGELTEMEAVKVIKFANTAPRK